MDSNTDKNPLITPATMCLRLLQCHDGQPEIYCHRCGGWRKWTEGEEICTACQSWNQEASVLTHAMQDVRNTIKIGGTSGNGTPDRADGAQG